MPASVVTPESQLRAEASVLGRFLVRRAVEPEFVDRYVAAHAFQFLDEHDARDRAILAWAVAHPSLLPCVDAALALRRPDALLHKKALLMAAILEASPAYVDEFLPRAIGVAGLAFLGLRLGLGTALHLAIGVPLLWWCGTPRTSATVGASP